MVIKLAAAGALATASVLSAAPAQATPAQYLAYLGNNGIYSPGGSATLLDWGRRVCVDAAAGATPEYSAGNIDYLTSLDFEGAMVVVTAAKLYLC